jgi:hypothetical protein
MHAVQCPACREQVSIDPADFGYPVACPLCGASFTPRRPGSSLTAEDDDNSPYGVKPEESRRRYRPRFDEEGDEDFDRPRSHRRQLRQPVDQEEAERQVAGPARGLILTGWIGAVFFLLFGLTLIGGGIAALDAADPDLREMGGIILAYGIVSFLFGTPYAIVLAIGGQKLKQLSSKGWAYTAAIMGIVTIGLCGPLFPFTWAAFPIGLWAIFALNKPDVKAVFEANRQR